MTIRKKRKGALLRRMLMRASQMAAILVVLSIVSVLVLRWAPPPITAVMLQRRIDAWIDGRSYRLDYRWVSWNRISRNAALAAIAAEDQNFAEHHGFDFGSIQKAWDAHEHGKRLRGASTISQQVAKNVFLWPGRSFIRKGLEAYFTLLIELAWPKRRILEVYLNVVELGDGVFGVEAAGRRYFRTPAASLTSDESALLAAVLPNPLRFKASRPSGYVTARRAWIVRQMGQLGGVGFLKRL